MWSARWQRRLEEEEEEECVLEEAMRRSEWRVFAHSWEEAPVKVESTSLRAGGLGGAGRGDGTLTSTS